MADRLAIRTVSSKTGATTVAEGRFGRCSGVAIHVLSVDVLLV